MSQVSNWQLEIENSGGLQGLLLIKKAVEVPKTAGTVRHNGLA
jgi:hypothetical protein